MMKDEEDADTINDYKETIKVILDEKNWEAPTRMLYSVEIPEDNGSNYLSWDKPITDKQAQTIESKLVENDIFLENSRNVYESILNGLSDKSMMPPFEEWIQDRASVIAISGKENGQRLYKEFENMLGSDKEASEFLGSIGFVGVVYPAEYRSGGREDNAHNYVIFDDSNLAITDKVSFSKKETDDKERPHLYGGLYSNAEKAVLDIKQNKATADQWLNMLKNNGGLKEGEDKWMGLSDWLKLRRGMTTKDEVLDFIRKNTVEIEEVNYTESEDAPKEVQDKFDKYMNELGDEQEAWDRLVDEYGDDFDIAFWVDEGKVLINNAEAANTLFDIPARPIDDARLLYTTKGLKNKREVALTVPTIEAYNENDETHFGDAGEGRAVAWCRFGETTDADGNRVLVVDEVQSKRHQDGREKGYKKEAPQDAPQVVAYESAKKALDDYMEQLREKYGRTDLSYGLEKEERTKLNELHDKELKARIDRNRYEQAEHFGNFSSPVPTAPFDKNWHELVMKRMLRYAAENDYDKVAWTSGEQQAERYNIGNVVNTIDVSPYEAQSHNEVDGFDVDIHVNDADTKTLFVSKDGVISGGEFAGMKLADVLGKELANDILSTTEYREIDGKDLRIGGEGMKGFYDKILPNYMNKFGKKFGAKVGVVTLPDVEEAGREMWSVDVTPEMKRTAMEEGFPMFSKKEREEHIEKANKKFNEEIDKFTIPDADKFNFKLGRPSETLIAAGVADKPILLYGNKLAKKIGKHGFKAEDLKDLPKKMENPIAVFNNYGNDDNRSILTELTTSQGNVLVAVNVGKNNYADFNIVASAFGKGQDKVIDWFKRGYATYIDKKKALNYLYSSAPIAATPNNKELYDAANVVKSFDEAKFWNDYNTSQTKNNASVSANNNNLQSAVDNSGVNFSADENEPFERDAAGRPKSINITTSEILTDEGRAKYNAWANAVKEWDKAHPLDMKNRKAAAKAVASVVREALKGGGLNEVETAELNKFLNTMSNTSTTNIMDMSSRAFKVAAGAISKAHDKTINKLLSLKLTDKNGKNMSVAGSVDYNAQEIFKILKENWDNFDSDAVNKRIEYLNKKIGKHAEDVAEGKTPDEPWTQDDSNELTALETLLHNKTVKDIGNEIKEIIGEQKSLEAQKKENYQKYKNAEISPDTYKSKRDSLEAELESLDKELNERLNAKIDAEQAVIDKLTEIAEGGREDKKSWQERE
ncbi:MAG: hypothetical protein J6Y15_11650, partial [Bacteroidaceae bacterium]|nr:hypothetical protein [Bacteroidaceae bacterium]